MDSVFLLLCIIAIVATPLLVYAIIHYNQVQSNCTIVHEMIKDVLVDFKQWNQSITTKKGCIDFYATLDRFLSETYGTNLRLQITEQEFDKMTVTAIKQLNDQALDEIIDQLKKQTE